MEIRKEIQELIAELEGRDNPTLLRSRRDCSKEENHSLIQAIGKRHTPNFEIDTDNVNVYSELAYWCEGQPCHCFTPNGMGARLVPASLEKGVYLYGNVGTGKSLCLDVLAELCGLLGLQFKYRDRVSYLKWPTYRTDEVCADVAETGDLMKYKTMPIVCFQDLGCEPQETLYMGNRHRVMREIIEYRGDQRGIITLFSSNIPFARLGEVYGARAQSRIVQMCNPYYLGGGDRRR